MPSDIINGSHSAGGSADAFGYIDSNNNAGCSLSALLKISLLCASLLCHSAGDENSGIFTLKRFGQEKSAETQRQIWHVVTRLWLLFSMNHSMP